MSITAKELAKELGISAAAVSMALNGKPGVSENTRERIVSYAKERGYDFGKVHSLGSGKRRIVFLLYKKHGAVVSDTPFFSELTEGISRACKENNCIMDIEYILMEDSTRRVLGSIIDRKADGVVLLATEMQAEDFRPFEDFPLPTVVLDTYYEGLSKNCVLINNVQGAYMATNYLIKKRKQQPGYLRSSYSIGNFEERADGFYKAIRENGLSPSRSVIHRLTPSVDGAYVDMKMLLAAGEPIADCYFADNDNIAVGAMRAFKEAGYRIPEDIGFIGFDNTTLCELIEPALATVNVPKLAMGRIAVERLLALMKGRLNDTVKMEILTNLVKRRSL